MTNERVQQACESIARLVDPAEAYIAQRHEVFLPDSSDEIEHLLFMCEEIPGLLCANRREKAMRWLGYLQGYVHARGLCGLADLKKMNMPEGETLDRARL